MTAIDLAVELVSAWAGYLRNIGNPDDDGEDLAAYIDLSGADYQGIGLPEEVEPEEIRSSFILLNVLNFAMLRGLEVADHQILQNAHAEAMRVLASRVGMQLPEAPLRR